MIESPVRWNADLERKRCVCTWCLICISNCFNFVQLALCQSNNVSQKLAQISGFVPSLNIHKLFSFVPSLSESLSLRWCFSLHISGKYNGGFLFVYVAPLEKLSCQPFGHKFNHYYLIEKFLSDFQELNFHQILNCKETCARRQQSRSTFRRRRKYFLSCRYSINSANNVTYTISLAICPINRHTSNCILTAKWSTYNQFNAILIKTWTKKRLSFLIALLCCCYTFMWVIRGKILLSCN